MANSTQNSAIFRSALSAVDLARYDAKTIDVQRTRFLLLTRKAGGLPREKLERSLKLYWPKLQRRLKGIVIHEAAIIDFDAPFGGGPMGKFVVGIYSSASVSAQHQKLIQEATDWEPLQSTEKYIKKHYGGFPDPEQAYVDDMVIHELGHLFFGFGKTEAPKDRPADLWFSFGLGLVYDRLVWNEIHSTPSPLFDAITSKWKTQFSARPEVDQRLINPDTSKDAVHGLARLQTYGHGKALHFLRELRHRIGDGEFDKTVRAYLARPTDSAITYDSFLELLAPKHRSIVQKTELEFSVR